jgi:hypothetical protein
MKKYYKILIFFAILIFISVLSCFFQPPSYKLRASHILPLFHVFYFIRFAIFIIVAPITFALSVGLLFARYNSNKLIIHAVFWIVLIAIYLSAYLYYLSLAP